MGIAKSADNKKGQETVKNFTTILILQTWHPTTHPSGRNEKAFPS